MIRVFVLSLSIVFLSACGGGGDSTTLTPTDPNQLFSLSVLKYNSTGTANEPYTTQLGGTITDTTGTYNASGSYLLAWKDQTLFSGQMANPQEHNSFINYFTSAGVLSASVYYRLNLNISDGTPIGFSRPAAGFTCTISSSSALPDTAKIGDTNTYLTDTCSNNTTDTVTWEITDALGGSVYVVFKVINRDSSTNALKEVVEMKTKLDGSGNVVGFQLTAALLNLGIDVSSPSF